MSSRKIQLLADLKSALNLTNHHGVVTSAVLEVLVKGLGGKWGAYWYVDEASQLLRFNLDWQSPGFNSTTLDGQLQNRTFSPGEGMPGAVWRSKKAAWSRDIAVDMMLPRSLKALNAGLEVGLWIPVVNKNRIIGIIEVLGCRNDILASNLGELLQAIGEQIGDHIPEDLMFHLRDCCKGKLI